MVFRTSSIALTTLSLDLEASRTLSSGTVGVDWSKEELVDPIEELPLVDLKGLNLIGGGDIQKVENSTTGEVSSIKTRVGNAGVRFQFGESWNLNLSASSTETPETYYKETGPLGNLTYKINGNWKIGLKAGSSAIEQKYYITILNRTFERSILIDKQYSGLLLKFTLPELFAITLSGANYKYSKTKEEIQSAYQNQFLNNYATELVSSISGLPESTSSLDFVFFASDSIDLGFFAQSTVLMSDGSRANRYEVSFNKYLKKYSLGGGIGATKTDSSTSGFAMLNVGVEI